MGVGDSENQNGEIPTAYGNRRLWVQFGEKNSRVQGRCAASRGAGTWGYPGEVCAGVENWKIGRKTFEIRGCKEYLHRNFCNVKGL